MEYRKLGAIETDVSLIGFGAASLSGDGGGYGFGSISDENAIGLVHASTLTSVQSNEGSCGVDSKRNTAHGSVGVGPFGTLG